MDYQKAVSAAKDMLLSLDIDLTDNNYGETPRRLVEVLTEFTQSFRHSNDQDLDQFFATVFHKHNRSRSSYKGMVVQSPIRVYSLCSHHLLPVIYDISFAYIPNGNLIGFSKVARIIKSLARKPGNQEDFTQEVMEVFQQNLRPKGLAVVISGIHMCMKMRGVECDAVNRTSAVRGDFKDYERTRDEFLSLATKFNFNF